MAGTITIGSVSGTTLTLNYTPGPNMVTATLHMIRHDSGAETTQAVVSGANSITIVPGKIYLFIVAEYDVAVALDGFSNILFRRMPSTGEGTDFTVRWRTDYDADWQEVGLDEDEVRSRIPTNRMGHHMQVEVQTHVQNERMTLKNFQLTARMGGRAYAGRQSE